uniref:Uncharacterized protein n=1 Tax=Lactuca sativa TaxID=4236 RepID=A0A9R1WI77_LACSA|nr:hypothetical protein LSAT_V11C100018780 [Lactuca sativa]
MAHKDLVSKGGEWMKGTSGCYNQNGLPIYPPKRTLHIICHNACHFFSFIFDFNLWVLIHPYISLCLVAFFLKAIPKKILICLGTLFLLIMMVAILICIFVVMLMISYAKLHSSLLTDWFHPTCCSIHLYKSLRRLFFYENLIL